MHLLPFIVGQEFQALFMSTTEPVDAEGNTTNPTKSPCDPYIFNSVLTRSKSLVVVVGSPWALLGIEEHMEKLYGKKAHCWSSYIRLCLENDTFIIPPEVEPSEMKRLKFSLLLKAKLFDDDTSRIAHRLADSLHCELPVPPVQQIHHSRQHDLLTSVQHPASLAASKTAAPKGHRTAHTVPHNASAIALNQQSLRPNAGQIVPNKPVISHASATPRQQNHLRVPPELDLPSTTAPPLKQQQYPRQQNHQVQDRVPPKLGLPPMPNKADPPKQHKPVQNGTPGRNLIPSKGNLPTKHQGHRKVQNDVPPSRDVPAPCKFIYGTKGLYTPSEKRACN